MSLRVFTVIFHIREKENGGKGMRFVYTTSRSLVCFDLSPEVGQSFKRMSPSNEVDSWPLSKIKYAATATTIIKTGVRGSFTAAREKAGGKGWAGK